MKEQIPFNPDPLNISPKESVLDDILRRWRILNNALDGLHNRVPENRALEKLVESLRPKPDDIKGQVDTKRVDDGDQDVVITARDMLGPLSPERQAKLDQFLASLDASKRTQK